MDFPIAGVFMLCIMVTIGRGVQGLAIRQHPPQTPAEGQMLSLVCYVPDPSVYAQALARGRCKIHWSWKHFSAADDLNGHVEQNTRQKTYVTVNAARLPIKTTLYIDTMTSSQQGRYTCHMTCPELKKSVLVNLKMEQDEDPGKEQAALIVCLLIVAIVVILLVMTGAVAIRDRCRAYKVRRQRAEQVTRYAAPLVNNAPPGDQCGDPPPAYSLVVVVQSSDLSSGALKQQMSEQQSEVASHADSVFVMDAPSYEDALEQLASSGARVDWSQLEPRPPAYSDLDIAACDTDAARESVDTTS